jgi:hypothetical protein
VGLFQELANSCHYRVQINLPRAAACIGRYGSEGAKDRRQYLAIAFHTVMKLGGISKSYLSEHFWILLSNEAGP